MKRRAFLEAAGKASIAAAVTASTWPQFLREAFAADPAPPPVEPPSPPEPSASDKAKAAEEARRERLAVISDGYRRAQKAGKPLLVIVIPEDRSHRWQRGEYFGSYLNHGSVEQLYALALTEVICAGMNDLRQIVPTVGLGEPLMVLVETDRVPATVRRLEARMPDLRNDKGGFPQSPKEYEERSRREEREIETRIALLGKLIHGAVAANAAMIDQRVSQARAALAADAKDIESALVQGRIPDVATADRAAALVAHAALTDEKAPHGELHKLLAKAVEQRLRKQRVPGSHWARHSGCGTTVEGAEDRGPMIACGMGHVPEKSWRFLYFFSVPRRGTLTEY